MGKSYSQNKPHKLFPKLFKELCRVRSSRVVKRQLRKLLQAPYVQHIWDCSELAGAFIWEASIQGQSYWEKIRDELVACEGGRDGDK